MGDGCQSGRSRVPGGEYSPCDDQGCCGGRRSGAAERRALASFSRGTNHPPPSPGGCCKRSSLSEAFTALGLSYPCTPWRSGTSGACSGRSPAINISAMSRTPAHPPATKPTTTHQNETIRLPPFSRPRGSPGTDPAPRLRCCKKNPALSPDPSPTLSARCLHRVCHSPSATRSLAMRIRVALRSAGSAALRSVGTNHLQNGPAGPGLRMALRVIPTLANGCHPSAVASR